MEDRWHGPEDPTNEEPETTRKKRRGSDFLSQYLLRRREQQGEKTEEDDEEETEEKPKKFRRFFKSLFKNVVEPPAGSTESGPKHFGLEALFLDKEQETDATETVTENSDEFEPVAAKEQADQISESISNSPHLADSGPEEPQVLPRAETTAPTPETEITPDDNQPHLETMYEEPRTYEQPTDRTVYERVSPQPTEKEVVIERGVGMALPVVLVGAEYLARKKADRKLDAKYSDKVSRLETDTSKNTLVTEQLDNLVKQNREQLEALKRDRGIEASGLKQAQVPERSAARAESTPAEQPQPLTRVERQPQNSPDKLEERETHKIMEQVADAAEHNMPVERVFERSHEVKDDQSQPVGAASIGAIMAAKTAEQSLSKQTKTPQSPQDQGSLSVISAHAQNTLYKQAMRNGFWAAIVIIILGTIAYLLK